MEFDADRYYCAGEKVMANHGGNGRNVIADRAAGTSIDTESGRPMSAGEGFIILVTSI